jgi:hypothetical protein
MRPSERQGHAPQNEHHWNFAVLDISVKQKSSRNCLIHYNRTMSMTISQIGSNNVQAAIEKPQQRSVDPRRGKVAEARQVDEGDGCRRVIK